MANKDNRHKRSVCEMSMLLVANVIRLSSVSFAGQCFTKNLPPQDERTHDLPPLSKDNTTSVTKFSKKSQRSRQSEKNQKPRSYLMKPEKEGPTLVRQEINDVDVSAENYISQIRGKIGSDVKTTATTATTSGTAKRFSSSFSGTA